MPQLSRRHFLRSRIIQAEPQFGRYGTSRRPPTRAQGRIGASWDWMQFDRFEANTLRQVDNDELPPALGQRQGEDQPVRARRHRLDAGAARNVDRRGGESVSSHGGGSAARYPAGDERDQSSKA